MNEHFNISIQHNLDINTEVATNTLNEFNNRQLRHWPQLSFRDRASLIGNRLYHFDLDPNANISQNHSPDVYERRLMAERLSISRRITEYYATLLDNYNVSDPRSDTLRAASLTLCEHNFTYVRRLISNAKVASQLQNCSTRAPRIAADLGDFQDSID